MKLRTKGCRVMVPSARRAALKTAGAEIEGLDQENVGGLDATRGIRCRIEREEGPGYEHRDKCRCHACETERNGWRGRQCAFAYAVMCTCVRILSTALIVKSMPVALSLPVKRRTSRGRLR